MLSISQFSLKTGLSPSALRYYESKGLLVPSLRKENGYRMYANEQVDTAKLIHSLRQAHISMEEIARFLQADEGQRESAVSRWRGELESQMLGLAIARQYLGSVPTAGNKVHLIRWEEETRLIWFKETIPVRQYPEAYDQSIKRHQAILAARGAKAQDGAYVRLIRTDKEYAELDVGFRLVSGADIPQAVVQTFPRTLFLTMECRVGELFFCMKLNRFLNEHGFRRIGQRLERYTPGEDTFTMMIPVIQS
ncbi:MerR family transcriptional regulator [Paenibacillus flagellatus]|uniref:MerR family transcriptional regulator n=1 Tax=Paenibacillus flagellatus TaxID=2211139 RepID=UPI0013051FC0|nr:MerR family transcriptional regulator [Paenibacillus flagellatus]